MIGLYLFLWKNQILNDVKNLPNKIVQFFNLSKKNQRKVLDKYFAKFNDIKKLETYFIDSCFYKDNQEITFFSCYYFDKKILEYNVCNLYLIDKFKIPEEQLNYLIKESINKIAKDKTIEINSFVHYPDELPKILSSNIEFMDYFIEKDPSSIKYITMNNQNITKQRELIQKGIILSMKQKMPHYKFKKNDGEIPKILLNNIDFINYLIKEDIENINYLDESLLSNLTATMKDNTINNIIKSLDRKKEYLKTIEKNLILKEYLNQEEKFLNYIISIDIENIIYIDFHHLTDKEKNKIINYITQKIETENINLNIMKYPFRDLFFQNYNFMNYLIKKDFRWLTITKVNQPEELSKLIDLFFQKIKEKNYQFHLKDFLETEKNINPILIEDKRILHYFFQNKVPVIQYIDFFQIKSSKQLVENILNEMEKKDFEFHNKDFLVNKKYPIPLSNSYRFMRYVIDKNFNNLSYIDISMIDKRELQRIINYAFRMVYYIRGENKKLNFDIDGYFKGTDILENEYFQECLKNL